MGKPKNVAIWGGKARYRWAQDQGISLTINLIKPAVLQCPICQHIKHRSLPHLSKDNWHVGKYGKLIILDPLI